MRCSAPVWQSVTSAVALPHPSRRSTNEESNRLRVETAKCLLAEGDAPIKSISGGAGFES